MADTGTVNTAASNTSSFVSALVIGLVVAGVYISVFFLLHGKARRVYQPRYFLAPENKRPSLLPNSPLSWFVGIAVSPDSHVLEMNGPDAYFFVRYCRFMILLLVPYWLLTWVVLFPVSAAPPNAGATGLNIFTFGNVSIPTRRVAHLLVAVTLISYTLWMLYREYAHFLQVRQAWLSSPDHARLASSRTVMLVNTRPEWNSEEKVRKLADFVGGPVETVWLARNVPALEKVYNARNEEVARLEKAEANVAAAAAKNVRKNKLPQGKEEDADLIARYVPDKKRPQHKIGPLSGPSLGFFGTSVDTLSYSVQQVQEQTTQIAEERAKIGQDEKAYPLVTSVFLRFSKQTDAHAFAAGAKRQTGTRTLDARTELVPEDIIWSNLGMSPYMRIIRTTISWALTVGLIIVWLPLVALVGVISNVNTLCSEVVFLAWLCKLPATVQGIIQGVLPPVLLAVLFMLLPIFLRLIITMQGEPRRSDVEHKLWARLWIFYVIHGFLIVAIASGLASALSNISSTVTGLPTALADKLPDSAIFFLTFILTVTLSTASSTISRAVPWIMTKLAFLLRGSTPRKAVAYDWKLSSISLATTWPPTALLAVIGIVYTVIQPVTVGFAAVGFYLLYTAYKYMLIWVCEQPAELETGGLYYPAALATVFTALYIEEVCLAALFFLSNNATGYAGGAIIVAMGVITVVFQVWVERSFKKRFIYVDPAAAQSANDDTSTKDAAEHAAERENATTDASARAFDNPAIWKDAPVVWVADDTLGIGRSEVTRLNEAGVVASSEYAHMSEKGYVTAERGPPDEEWDRGKLPE